MVEMDVKRKYNMSVIMNLGIIIFWVVIEWCCE